MGIKFSKVIPLAVAQVVPPEQEKTQITKLQQRLLDKLGGNAYPFYFKFPSTAPSSVVLLSGDPSDKSKPLGVEYRVRAFVGESADDPGHKRSTVSLAVKKVSHDCCQAAKLYLINIMKPTFYGFSFIFSYSCNSHQSNVWIVFLVQRLQKVLHFLKAESRWK